MMTSRELIRTRHLTLRPWLPTDGPALATLAADPTVQRATGLTEHPDAKAVARALEDLSGEPEVFAITTGDGKDAPLGSIALRIGGLSGYDIGEDEGVIDYWSGPELRHSGLMPEATRALMRYAFEDLGLSAVRAPQDGAMGRITREGWQTANEVDSTERHFVSGQQAEADVLEGRIARIARIRSGGQTGADRGGLDAAREAGVPICGWCPKGGLAEDLPEAPGVRGPYPELRETETSSYVTRTAWNVRDSHATLVVAPEGLEPRSGTEMTVRFAQSYGRPFLVVSGPDDLSKVRMWLSGLGRGITLNVAGPRESKLPGTYALTKAVISGLLA